MSTVHHFLHYIVFRATIELRQQGFVWWIKDLSSPDTIATLPFSIPMYGDTVNVLPIFRAPAEANGKRRVMGAIAVFHDITRLRRLETIRQDFVANVSHELRTPLTTIKGYAETLLEGALNEDVAPRFVEIVKRHADRLTKIVEDLLTLSTIESKQFTLTLEPISVSDLIDDVIDFLKEPAEKKGISVTRGDLPSPLFVRGDRKHLAALRSGRDHVRGSCQLPSIA